MANKNQNTDPTIRDEFSKLAVITALVKGAPRNFGRTGLMKCLFFLQSLKNMSLPYNFRLYTYGPFDSHVLEDLQYAESLGAIRSTIVHYLNGYGYQLQAGPDAAQIEARGGEFVTKNRENIDWVLHEFGNRSAMDLEMASTLIFIDRAFDEKKTKAQITELASKVHDVKPHLKMNAIVAEAESLRNKGFLKSLA